jgi:hypothetical protein
MKNLLEVSNIMFKDKSNWIKVTDEEKSAYFFIFNRYFSKKYPDFSQLLNSKEIDKYANQMKTISFRPPESTR